MAREVHTEINEIMGDWLVFFYVCGYFLISQVESTPGLQGCIRPLDRMLDAPVLGLLALVT
jgi:hypothetical protein